MNWKLFISLILITKTLQADVAHGVLEKHRQNHRIFVGTGMDSYVTVARAINAGFAKIFSLEEDPVLVEHKKHAIACNTRFSNYHALQGNPASELSDLMLSIDEPMTIFLGTFFPDMEACPAKNTILDELDQISKHPINNHTILIDYAHYIGTPVFGDLSLQEIKNKILEINDRYKFAFEKGGHLEKEENAVLVAYLD